MSIIRLPKAALGGLFGAKDLRHLSVRFMGCPMWLATERAAECRHSKESRSLSTAKLGVSPHLLVCAGTRRADSLRAKLLAHLPANPPSHNCSAFIKV